MACLAATCGAQHEAIATATVLAAARPPPDEATAGCCGGGAARAGMNGSKGELSQREEEKEGDPGELEGQLLPAFEAGGMVSHVISPIRNARIETVGNSQSCMV